MPTGPFTYNKSPVALDGLDLEIRASAISVALDGGTSTLGTVVTIPFKADLTDAEKTILDELVTAHTGIPLVIVAPPMPVSVQSQPDVVITQLPPFAQPTYRSKFSAVDSLVSVAPNLFANIDFQLTSERYVQGGDLVIENAEIGDYFTASVMDVDGVIPAPYRAALCEAWPIAATYIVKQFAHVETPGSVLAGSGTIHEIDTQPLNAKISAGLYLRVTYYATNTGLTRRVGVNYHLTKKL